MPELPEVETVRRGLEPLMVGQVIRNVQVRVPKLRTPIPRHFTKKITGQTVLMLQRRAKYILIHLTGDVVILVHLGMTGGFYTVDAGAEFGKHDHIILTFGNGTVLAFYDPRRFGQIDIMPTANILNHPSLASLGPEPLEPRLTGKILAERLAGKRVAIKQALLDQRVVAGIGNIYASEALFYAGIHPDQMAGALTRAQTDRLAGTIYDVLDRSIAAGGSTLRDYRQVSGELGFFQDRFAVYDRAGQPCPGCTCKPNKTGGIARQVQGGRSTFFCPIKQKLKTPKKSPA